MHREDFHLLYVYYLFIYLFANILLYFYHDFMVKTIEIALDNG